MRPHRDSVTTASQFRNDPRASPGCPLTVENDMSGIPDVPVRRSLDPVTERAESGHVGDRAVTKCGHPHIEPSSVVKGNEMSGYQRHHPYRWPFAIGVASKVSGPRPFEAVLLAAVMLVGIIAANALI